MEIWKFVIHNWHLFLSLAIVIVMLLWEPVRRARYRYSFVGPAEAVTVINREQAAVVDTRTASEFQKGHIVNAQNIPHAELKNRLGDLDKYKARPVIVVCRNSQLSTRAAVLMRKHGLEDVRVMAGGINAWLKAQLPVEK
jgi:rhodanese-related sulfurtransferase